MRTELRPASRDEVAKAVGSRCAPRSSGWKIAISIVFDSETERGIGRIKDRRRRGDGDGLGLSAISSLGLMALTCSASTTTLSWMRFLKPCRDFDGVGAG